VWRETDAGANDGGVHLITQCAPDSPPLDCLRGLWQVSLNDRVLSSDALIQAERFDLNLRGLIGVVPLDQLQPGLHTLELRWNSGGDASILDDRYDVSTLTYRIPFMFAPGYELGLDSAAPPIPLTQEQTP